MSMKITGLQALSTFQLDQLALVCVTGQVVAHIDIYIGNPPVLLYGLSNKFVWNLQRWLHDAVGVNCTNHGDCMKHGIQKDWFLCSVVLPNTISHNVFGDGLWIPRQAVSDRIEWFLELVEGMKENIEKADNHEPKVWHCTHQ